MCYNNTKQTNIMFNAMENTIHDIKSPISIIFSALQELGELNTDANSTKLISIAKNKCISVMDMIQALIDSGRVISGGFKPEYRNQNIVSIIENILYSMSTLASRKNIEIIFDTDTEEKEMALDNILFERLICNIVSNAVKYSPQGGRIDVCFFDNKDFVLIEIKDEGEGISDDVRNSLFERYVTEGKSPDSSGLGLTIAKEIVSALGGKVYALNGNKGARICVELPAKLVAER